MHQFSLISTLPDPRMGVPGTPPPISFIFMQFSGNNGQIMGWNWHPSLLGNPRSATAAVDYDARTFFNRTFGQQNLSNATHNIIIFRTPQLEA